MKVLFPAFGLLASLLFISNPTPAQTVRDYSGAYKYEVRNTPSGDFFGTLTLRKEDDKYVGEIVNDKGRKFTVNFLRLRDDRLIFSSNVEDTNNSIFTCDFKGDSLRATIEVKGDDFLYKLRGKKVAANKPE
jgi:hypothetical protein